MSRTSDKLVREVNMRGLTVTAAAEALGMTRPNFSNVLNGHAALSIPLALKIEETWGMKAERLLIGQLRDDIDAERSKR